MTAIEQIRAEFESCIRSSARWKGNTPLGTMTINGQFDHYMDADTDTMWIGFALGYRTAEKLADERRKLIAVIGEISTATEK